MLYFLESNDKKGNLYIGHRCSRMSLQGVELTDWLLTEEELTSPKVFAVACFICDCLMT